MTSRLQIEYRQLGQLKLNPRNARTHSEAQVGEIAASIQQFGFVNPMLLDQGDIIIAGEGRYRAAQKLGLTEGPTIKLSDLTETQILDCVGPHVAVLIGLELRAVELRSTFEYTEIPVVSYHFAWPGHGHVAKAGDAFQYPEPTQMML